MAKFIFSMQSLLNIKEKLEEQEKNNYSQANMRLLEAQAEYDRLVLRRQEAEHKLRGEISEALNIVEIRRRKNEVEILKGYVAEQKEVVIQREQELEIARQRLNEARKEKKTFEKLREKAFEKFLAEENVREQKEVDELVSYRFGSGTR
ncbi:MAG: flagellar export protein FliJ [Lachnospiraceae bacterium]|nr:flagellar export protein FliJ [Lachnospiraceae bacterium]